LVADKLNFRPSEGKWGRRFGMRVRFDAARSFGVRVRCEGREQ